MSVEDAIAAIKAGETVRIVVGPSPEDPTLLVYDDDDMVICRVIAGWSAGMVEPVCSIASPFLTTYLSDRLSLTVEATA